MESRGIYKGPSRQQLKDAAIALLDEDAERPKIAFTFTKDEKRMEATVCRLELGGDVIDIDIALAGVRRCRITYRISLENGELMYG